MDEALEQIRLTLHDVGCTEGEIHKALLIYQAEGAAALLRQLRKCRCNRMKSCTRASAASTGWIT